MNEDDEKLKATLQSVRESPEINITVPYIPSWEKLFADEYTVAKPPTEKYDLDSLCIVLHSSGSTALPELNMWTHKMVHTALWQPYAY
ncbi:hypothetical protein CPB84DRAFT_1848220 [Gymnopilus junonius]|uniref:Uncharacterized protein n=1 Tax=Gymnopilus junonius TaxID=109634 RepID=A0A9P5TL48_GYMJU|nr:hypothetical protein CPB84DRAFT_1848220 [Gymnopilus junonius]